MPPGTGDVGLSLGQLLPRSEAVAGHDAAARRAARRRARGADGREARPAAAGRDREHVEPRLPVLRRGDVSLRAGRRRRARRRSSACRCSARCRSSRRCARAATAASPCFSLRPERPRVARDRGDRPAHRGHGPGARRARCASRRRSRSSRADPALKAALPVRGTPVPCHAAPIVPMRNRGPGGGALGRASADRRARYGACALGRGTRRDGRDRPAGIARDLCRCSPTATCSSRTCPASARRRSPGHRAGDRRPRLAHPVHRDLTAAEDVIGQEIESTNPAFRPTSSSRGPAVRERRRASTSSTARRRACSPACSRRWRSARSRSASAARPAAAVLLHRHDEPARQLGTFELAPRTCDRFAMRTGLGYPSESGERDLLDRVLSDDVTAGERSDRRSRRRRAAAEGHRAAPCARSARVKAYLVRPRCAPRATIRTSSSARRRARCSTMFRCCQAADAAATTPPRSPSSTCASLFEPCIEHRSACGRTPRARRVRRDPRAHAGARHRRAADDRRERRPSAQPAAVRSPRSVSGARAQVLEHDGIEPDPRPPAGLEILGADEVAQRRRHAVRPAVAGIAGAREQLAHLVAAARPRAAAADSSGVVPVSRSWSASKRVAARRPGSGGRRRAGRPAGRRCRRSRRWRDHAIAADWRPRRSPPAASPAAQREQQAVGEVALARLEGLGHRVDDVGPGEHDALDRVARARAPAGPRHAALAGVRRRAAPRVDDAAWRSSRPGSAASSGVERLARARARRAGGRGRRGRSACSRAPGSRPRRRSASSHGTTAPTARTLRRDGDAQLSA